MKWLISSTLNLLCSLVRVTLVMVLVCIHLVDGLMKEAQSQCMMCGTLSKH